MVEMVQMRAMYGWEKPIYRRQGLKIMKKIRDLGIFDQTPRLLRIWTRLYDLYDQELEEQLEQLSDLFYKSDKVADRTKSASESKRDIAEVLELYFEECPDGRMAEYIISFVRKSPRLRVENCFS